MQSEQQEESLKGHQLITCFTDFVSVSDQLYHWAYRRFFSINPWANTDDKQKLNQDVPHEEYININNVISDVRDTVRGMSTDKHPTFPQHVTLTKKKKKNQLSVVIPTFTVSMV